MFLILGLVEAARVTYDWKITYVDNVNPDGLFPRRAIGVNGQWPIPAINVTMGDTLVINVQNALDVPTTLHSHGLFQNGTNYYDGVPGVTECGIAPGSSFMYEIPIQQYGTYWIHGHIDGQYVDGLQAPLIIQNPADQATYKYDQEYTISLTDWYHQQHAVLLDQFLSIFNPTGAEPTPDASVINHGDSTALQFVPGKTYRLRIIGMAAIAAFNVYMDDHTFQVIEVDGENVQPFETSVLKVAAAQRYSVLVTAKNTTDYNYLLHSKFDRGMVPGDTASPNATLAVVYKQGAPTYELAAGVASDYPSDPDAFDSNNFSPMNKLDMLTPDLSLAYTVNFDLYDDALNHGAFNNTVFKLPPVPSIFTALSMGSNASDARAYGPRTLPQILQNGQVVEIVINNNDGGNHPFHLHGHKFQVVATGDGVYDPATANFTKTNPVRRDTVIVQGGGYAVIRFVADNPGVWFFHCHIEWHLQAGLAAIFVEAPDLIQKNIKVPQGVLDQCKNRNILTSGNAAGFSDLSTFAGIPAAPSLYPTYMQLKGYASLIACIISALLGLGAVLWYTNVDV
ncbi:ferroxidase fet3 [Boothiomyces sp. JEL0838]|nr:ferroxidase fet3 [Boothiomyces sp. JEL0838]